MPDQVAHGRCLSASRQQSCSWQFPFLQSIPGEQDSRSATAGSNRRVEHDHEQPARHRRERPPLLLCSTSRIRAPEPIVHHRRSQDPSMPAPLTSLIKRRERAIAVPEGIVIASLDQNGISSSNGSTDRSASARSPLQEKKARTRFAFEPVNAR